LTNFQKLKKRIKKNEGYRNKAYKDILGFWTIGYGHLIQKNEKKFFNKTYSHKELLRVFDFDFQFAVKNYMSNYNKKKYAQNVKEVFIEMIYQMGIKKQKNFKKMIKQINKGNFFMAALEMKDSLWNKQTPKRVDALIQILLKKKYEKKR